MTFRIDTPPGPALIYVSSPDPDGTQQVTPIDHEALEDPRERAICRALLYHAIRLIEAADRKQSGGRP